MKIALLQFDQYPLQKEAIQALLKKQGYQVVGLEVEAEALILPHHLYNKLEASKKPWIAIWIEGPSALGYELQRLKNPPVEIISTQAWESNKAFLKRALKTAQERVRK